MKKTEVIVGMTALFVLGNGLVCAYQQLPHLFDDLKKNPDNHSAKPARTTSQTEMNYVMALDKAFTMATIKAPEAWNNAMEEVKSEQDRLRHPIPSEQKIQIQANIAKLQNEVLPMLEFVAEMRDQNEMKSSLLTQAMNPGLSPNGQDKPSVLLMIEMVGHYAPTYLPTTGVLLEDTQKATAAFSDYLAVHPGLRSLNPIVIARNLSAKTGSISDAEEEMYEAYDNFCQVVEQTAPEARINLARKLAEASVDSEGVGKNAGFQTYTAALRDQQNAINATQIWSDHKFRTDYYHRYKNTDLAYSGVADEFQDGVNAVLYNVGTANQSRLYTVYENFVGARIAYVLKAKGKTFSQSSDLATDLVQTSQDSVLNEKNMVSGNGPIQVQYPTRGIRFNLLLKKGQH